MLRFLRSGSKRTKAIWWGLTVVTVITFLGGFVFLFGAGLDSSNRARAQGAVGTVDGAPITRQEYANAIAEQRAAFQKQYGADPADRDEKVVETQAWRGLVAQHLMTAQAKALGLVPHNHEVVLALETSPPAALTSAEQFQTGGKFDSQKYAAALRNPQNDWSPYEAIIRSQLPMRKLQERLLASVKLSEPELREAFRDKFEKLDVTVVQVMPMTANAPAPSDADLQRVYDKYKSRFTAGARVQLEVLTVPRKYSDDDVKAAHQLAQSLADRARRGEDFAALARDYSEGPGAAQGGLISRVFQPSEFGALAPKMAALQNGEVTDPYQDNGRFVVIKLIDRVPDPTAPVPSMRVAQIVVKVHPNESAMSEQRDALDKLREHAARTKNLGRAAAEKGMATGKTEFFDLNGQPQLLFSVPEAAEWGLQAPVNAVSPVFESADAFVIVQVAAKHPAGPPPREELADALRQIAQLEASVERSRPRADRMAQRIAQGSTLEQAAAAESLHTLPIAGLNRSQPDPQLGAAPEMIGALFAAPPGKVIGPVRTFAGWYFGRVDKKAEPDSAAFEQQKGQVSTEILQRRQQTVFVGFLTQLREKAKIEDLRAETNR